MDLNDTRRRDAQQAALGNYWAGKCVALIDLLAKTQADRDHWKANHDNQVLLNAELRARTTGERSARFPQALSQDRPFDMFRVDL